MSSTSLQNMPGKRVAHSLGDFAKRLKKARLQAGLTGPQLAAKVGLERSAVPQYETGRAYPSLTVVQKMAQVLAVSLDWLCFDDYEAVERMQDNELRSYMLRADRLAYRERGQVKDFIEGLLARAKLEELERSKSKVA